MTQTTLLKLDYELLDFGHGRKLERFGSVVLDRPEVLATEPRSLSQQKWQALTNAGFYEQEKQTGTWKPRQGIPDAWNCELTDGHFNLSILLKPGRFKHIGIFPEQEENWSFLSAKLKTGDRFLNLFAYTGVSSLVAARVGADVYHVDASKSVVNWAAKNAAKNGIEKIHWVCDDALKFAQREQRRGHRYTGIIMDPPVYGKGKSGEHWRLEDKLMELVQLAKALLLPSGFLIINTYSPSLPLESMREICLKSRLVCNDSGWLGVKCRDGRKLLLSKYVLATAK